MQPRQAQPSASYAYHHSNVQGYTHGASSSAPGIHDGCSMSQMAYQPTQNFQQFQYPQVSSHYAQAYSQYYTSSNTYGNAYGAATNAGGYALPSNYHVTPHTGPSSAGMRTTTHARPASLPPVQSQWLQPGMSRCLKSGCNFQGSAKSIELHMMDRHLIYPPGWDKRKRKSDWDADPSLKGKPIPIQGTTIKLDTPEAIAQWIAERKKRFPTANRVEEKEQKLKEAIARGQLAPDDVRFPHRKKRRVDGDGPARADRGRGGRGRGAGRGRGRGRSFNHSAHPPREADEEVSAIGPQAVSHAQPSTADAATSTPQSLIQPVIVELESSGSDTDSDGPPEIISFKVAGDAVLNPETSSSESEDVDVARTPAVSSTALTTVRPVQKPPAKQPRRPTCNPFATRPSLLRNLLQPEIRMTVSNLSQAIRFLVDNNFLESVELKPGQASEKMIEVIRQTDLPVSSSSDQATSGDVQ